MDRIFRLGLLKTDSPAFERKAILLNKLVFFFTVSGVVGSIALFLDNSLPKVIDYYISGLTLTYIFPILFNLKRRYDATAFFLFICGSLATVSAPILLGIESNAHFLLLLIAGLPFVLFGREWGNKRLIMAVSIFPVWVGLQSYCHYNEPIIKLGQDALILISLIYSFLILSFSIYVSYNFTILAEGYGAKIKSQRDLLNQKNKRLEQYSYLASHDLKTPISNIEGFLTLLKMDLENPNEEVKESIEGIKMSIAQGRKTISDLLELARMTAQEEEIENLDLSKMLEALLLNMKKLIDESKATIISDFSKCESIMFGKTSFNSIMQNIISNAIKYKSPTANPYIEIKSKATKKYTSISITDNGLGIDLKKDGDKLFGQFKRIHKNAEGTGLGLSLVKSIVEERGGKIEVESALGKGSTFSILIPNNILK